MNRRPRKVKGKGESCSWFATQSKKIQSEEERVEGVSADLIERFCNEWLETEDAADSRDRDRCGTDVFREVKGGGPHEGQMADRLQHEAGVECRQDAYTSLRCLYDALIAPTRSASHRDVIASPTTTETLT
jgi:hypothetical protein